MHALALSQLDRFRGVAPVALRVVVGVIMAVHGWQKLTQMTPAGFGANMLDPLGVPAPTIVAWMVTWIELVGGILLVVGLFTRVAALLLALVLAGAVVLVKLDVGLIAEAGAMLPGAELDLALLAGLVATMLLGPGAPSVDTALGMAGATLDVDVEARPHAQVRG